MPGRFGWAGRTAPPWPQAEVWRGGGPSHRRDPRYTLAGRLRPLDRAADHPDASGRARAIYLALSASPRIDLDGRKSWCESDDPEFAKKAADVVGLYLAPPTRR